MNELPIRQQRRTVRVLPLAVKHWRTIHLGWTQKQLAHLATATATAKEAGITISPSTIAMIETGDRQPSLVVAEAIAEAMGIQLGTFGERLDSPAEQVA